MKVRMPGPAGPAGPGFTQVAVRWHTLAPAVAVPRSVLSHLAAEKPYENLGQLQGALEA